MVKDRDEADTEGLEKFLEAEKRLAAEEKAQTLESQLDRAQMERAEIAQERAMLQERVVREQQQWCSRAVVRQGRSRAAAHLLLRLSWRGCRQRPRRSGR